MTDADRLHALDQVELWREVIVAELGDEGLQSDMVRRSWMREVLTCSHKRAPLDGTCDCARLHFAYLSAARGEGLTAKLDQVSTRLEEAKARIRRLETEILNHGFEVSRLEGRLARVRKAAGHP